MFVTLSKFAYDTQSYLSLLQGRLFSYADTHRHRLGANYHQIPVNCPYAARSRNYQRDGPMTIDDNQGSYVCTTAHD